MKSFFHVENQHSERSFDWSLFWSQAPYNVSNWFQIVPFPNALTFKVCFYRKRYSYLMWGIDLLLGFKTQYLHQAYSTFNQLCQKTVSEKPMPANYRQLSHIGKLYLTSILLLDEIQTAGLINVPENSLVCKSVGPNNDIWRYNQYFYKPQPTLLSSIQYSC